MLLVFQDQDGSVRQAKLQADGWRLLDKGGEFSHVWGPWSEPVPADRFIRRLTQTLKGQAA